MLLRLTAALAARLRQPLQRGLPLHHNPLLDWTAREFQNSRTPLILAVNTASLYSVIIPGRGVKDAPTLMLRWAQVLGEILDHDGLAKAFAPHLATPPGPLQIGATLNRSVSGSMTDMVHMAACYMEEFPPVLAAIKINEAPMSMLKYKRPRVAFAQLLQM